MVPLAIAPDLLAVEELDDGPGSRPLGGLGGKPLAPVGMAAGSSPGLHLEESFELFAVNPAGRGNALFVGHEMEDLVLRLEIP
jgi:hypothetical protein